MKTENFRDELRIVMNKDYHMTDLFEAIDELHEKYVKLQKELLFQSYKEGFDSATESLIGANKIVQERKIQQ